MQSTFDASGGARRMRVVDDHGEGGEERGHREAHSAISFKQDDPATQRTRAEPVLQPGPSANVSHVHYSVRNRAVQTAGQRWGWAAHRKESCVRAHLIGS